MSKYADRVKDIEPFRVVEVLTQAKQMEAEGIDVVHMEAGEPDFSTVAPIIDAAKQALDDGATYYTSALGIPELRQKVSEFYTLRNSSYKFPPKAIGKTANKAIPSKKARISLAPCQVAKYFYGIFNFSTNLKYPPLFLGNCIFLIKGLGI